MSDSGKFTRRSVLAGLAATAGITAFGQTVQGSSPIEDRFVVDTRSTQDSNWRSGVTILREHPEIGVAIVTGDSADLAGVRFTNDFAIDVSPPEDPEVDAAELPAPEDHTTAPGSAFPLQWDKQSQGVERLHNDGVVGRGATISIIDDGVDPTHPDLGFNYDINGSNTFESDNVTPGDHIEDADHGSHVAGIAAGAGELAVLGTAPRAQIISQNVFFPPSEGGGASFANILSGIERSVAQNADVMNLSLGAYPVPPAVDTDLTVDVHARAAERAYQQGSLIVASAGNDAVNLDTDGDVVSLPNQVPGFMSISATGPIGFEALGSTNPNRTASGLDAESHLPALYTSYGANEIDVSAPGGNAGGVRGDQWFYDLVFSAVPADQGQTGFKAGTSMSAPQVTGAAALIASENPGATPEQLRQHIRQTASAIPVEYDISSYSVPYFGGVLTDEYTSETYRGSGHLNVQRAVEKAIPFPGGVSVVDETYFPTDPDDDGLYEDVNGDGVVDMDDAQVLYELALRGAPADADRAFDFNGDGQFDMRDVQAFIRQL